MSGYKKDFHISWDDFHRHGQELARKLPRGHKWKGIIAIARGGLLPAAIVAQELEIKLIETVCISSYGYKEQRKAEIIKDLRDIENGGKDWLVIDDLVDTGVTAQIIRDKLPNVHVGTLYAKPKGKALADTYVLEVDQETWIHFPWETELQEEDSEANIEKSCC